MTTRNPLDAPPTTETLWRLFDANLLPPSAWERAHQIARLRPTPQEWVAYLNRVLLMLGTALLVAGIFFFFAFNWRDLPRVIQFAVLQGAVVLCALGAYVARLETWAGRMLMLASALLIGTAMGVIGQAYQTGADSYQLFINWALLITGWVLISRWNILYLLWIILVNISIITYTTQVIGYGSEQMLNLTLTGVNLAFILAWDGLARFLNVPFMAQGRWFLYLPALALTAYITYFALDVLFAFDVRWVELAGYSWVVYVGVLGIMSAFYGFIRRDMGMVTLVALSLLVVMVAWVGRELAGIDEFLAFFGTGTFTLLVTTALAYSLLSLQRFWDKEEPSA